MQSRGVFMIGPLTLPAAESYTMRVQSSLLKQGASTPVHTHFGPEVFYVVSCEQCLETQKAAHRLKLGKRRVHFKCFPVPVRPFDASLYSYRRARRNYVPPLSFNHDCKMGQKFSTFLDQSFDTFRISDRRDKSGDRA